jgi:hypothetical protein
MAHHRTLNKNATHNNIIAANATRGLNRSRQPVRVRIAGLSSVNRTCRAVWLLAFMNA